MRGRDQQAGIAKTDGLFARVAAILDQARGNVVRAVNTNMVLAYWLIGREMVETIQKGEERAAYGGQVLSELSKRLQAQCGKGFSVPNLQRFRRVFLTCPGPGEISSPAGTKSLGSASTLEISSPSGSESSPIAKVAGAPAATLRASVSTEQAKPFAPQLTWSHYRALMYVKNARARAFYENEAIECDWTKAQLERQIQSAHYERMIARRGADGLLAPNASGSRVKPFRLAKFCVRPSSWSSSTCPTAPFSMRALWNRPSSRTFRPSCSSSGRVSRSSLARNSRRNSVRSCRRKPSWHGSSRMNGRFSKRRRRAQLRELLGELGSNRVLKKAEFRVGAKERRELKATVGWAHTVAERIIKADSSLPDNESVPAAAETARGADVNQENKIDFKREVVLQLKDAWSDTRKGERHEHHAGVGREIRLERHHKYERLGILDGFGGALDVLSRGIADKLGQVHT